MPQGETFELAETMAQVGDQYILKGDLIGEANLLMAPMWAQLQKVPPEERERAEKELSDYRKQIVENQLLAQAIDRKLKYLAFWRVLPNEPDLKKAEERRKKIQQTVNKRFFDDLDKVVVKLRDASKEDYEQLARQNLQLYRIALAMKEASVQSRDERSLDLMLRRYGTSLAKQQHQYLEHALGQSAIGEKVNFKPEITHEQMVSYYRQHEPEFQVPLMARWEQMSVHFKRFPNTQAAYDAIHAMGNEVLFGGTPFWAVAQRQSHEKNASKGGIHEWTAEGDLKISRQINEVVFNIPLNQLSRVIEDQEGLHIVRVLEREEAHQKPFETVQDEIKEKLRTELLEKQYTEYVQKLREQTPVYTVFDQANPPDRLATPNPSRNR